MAIVWGSWASGQSGSKSRLGIDRSTSTTASQITVSITVHFEFSGYYASSSGTLTLSGGHSVSKSVSLVFSGSGTRNLGTYSETFTRPWGSASSQNTYLSISGFAGGNPTTQTSYTLPRRLYSAPATPSSVSASRASDTQADVSWTVPASTSAPVSSVEIVRRTNTGSWEYSGAATSSSRSGTRRLGGQSRGNRYQYAVRAKNRDATGPYEYSGWVYQRPLDVANVVATRSGSDIRVSWVNRSAYPYGGYRVYDNGTLVAEVLNHVTAWTHRDPNPAQTHRYSVRAYYASLQAAHVYSNTVQLLSAPLAPTNLTPDGGTILAGSSVTLSWTHNPVDGTPQQAYTVRLRKAGGDWAWRSGTTASSSHTINVADFAGHGESIEWQVQTKGDHGSLGPYSPVATFDIASRPTVAFTAPASGATITAATVDVTFTISRTPASYTIEVRQGSTVVQKIEDYAVSSPVTRRISGLRDGVSYSLRISAFDRVSSTVVSRSISVAYPQPEPPTISGEWDPAHGATHLTVQRTAGTVTTTAIRVERWNGTDWEEADTVNVTAAALTIADNHANLTDATYRAIGLATIGVDTVESAPTEISLGPVPVEADFLTFGDQVVRIRYAPGVSRAPAASDLQLIDLDDGTPDPVAIFGPKERHVTTVSGMLIDEPRSSAREQAALVRELAVWKDLVLLRTIDAPPVWGVVSGVSQPRELWGGYQVSLTHTKAR